MTSLQKWRRDNVRIALTGLLQPAPWTPPPEVYNEFQQRLAEQDALLLMRGQVRNQLHALVQGPIVVAQVRTRMETLDQTITSQITEIEMELVTMGEAEEQIEDMNQEWVATIVHLQSIPGIGLLTAMWLVVCTLNFTLCSSAEQAAAYAGLAPMPRQSGTSVQKRHALAIAAMHDYERPCIWQPSPRHATIRSSSASTTVCVPKENRRRWRVVQQHAN